MKYIISSPIVYLYACIFLYLILQRLGKINRVWRLLFVFWFATSYLLMTSFGANALVKLISIDVVHKQCSSNLGILLPNGTMRYTFSDTDYAAMSLETLNRIHAARNWLLKDNARTLLITGSRANHEVSILKNYLLQLGISNDRVIVEDNSNTTFESAINSRLIFSPEKKVVLITSQIHMRRARLTFEKAGYLICPVVSHNQYIKVSGLRSLLPDSHAIIKSEKVIHELIGIVWYWKTDRI